ncbi:MAG: MOSC domain-containing protein [Spirochaetaceae bacterium]
MKGSPMGAHITGLFVAHRRKSPREAVPQLRLLPGQGIEGDAYAGPGDRQVVFFEDGARRALDAAEQQGLCYARFHENIRVEGLELGALAPGDRLALGEAVVEISSVSKRCYAECRLPPDECLIRGRVAFGRVTRGGVVAVGDVVEPAI